MAGRGVGGWGGRAGVQYSAAWSDLASLQRVMKQLRRSATYTPIFLPNERMSRAQVKNEPAQRGAALREKKKMGFLFPSQNSRLYCPPPSSKLWFQWGWLIKLKTTPPHPKTPILSTAASNLVCAVAVVGVYSCVISPTETFMQLGATKQIEVFAGEIKVLMTLRIMFDSRLTQWALYWVIAFFHPNVVRCLWGCLGFSLINIMLKKPGGKVYEAANRKKETGCSALTTALKVNECRALLPSGPDNAEMRISRRWRALSASCGGRRPAGIS